MLEGLDPQCMHLQSGGSGCFCTFVILMDRSWTALHVDISHLAACADSVFERLHSQVYIGCCCNKNQGLNRVHQDPICI